MGAEGEWEGGGQLSLPINQGRDNPLMTSAPGAGRGIQKEDEVREVA